MPVGVPTAQPGATPAGEATPDSLWRVAGGPWARAASASHLLGGLAGPDETGGAAPGAGMRLWGPAVPLWLRVRRTERCSQQQSAGEEEESGAWPQPVARPAGWGSELSEDPIAGGWSAAGTGDEESEQLGDGGGEEGNEDNEDLLYDSDGPMNDGDGDVEVEEGWTAAGSRLVRAAAAVLARDRLRRPLGE